METSDKIQFGIAVVAGLAAILTAINIWFTNKNFQWQKYQWEFNMLPIFKLSYIQQFEGNRTAFVIENSNHVYHEIDDVNFTMENVKVDKFFDGSIDTGPSNGERVIVAKGLIVILLPTDNLYYEGFIQIKGKDHLGKDFIFNSRPIKFKDYEIQNDLELSRTYLKKI